MNVFFRSPRLASLTVGVIAVLMLLAGWYLQHEMKQRPCPFCILQRYAFIAIALIGFSGAIWGRSRVGALLHWGGLLAASAAGVGFAIKMVFFTTAQSGCGTDAIADFVNGLPTADRFPQYFFANGGCTDVYPPIFGLTVPVWALVWFGVFGLIALTGLAARWRKQDDTPHGRWPEGRAFSR